MLHCDKKVYPLLQVLVAYSVEKDYIHLEDEAHF